MVTNIDEVYPVLNAFLKQNIKHSISVMLQLNDKWDGIFVYDILGLDNNYLYKIIRKLGINPVGKKYVNKKFVSKGYFATTKIINHTGDLYLFCEKVIPKWLCRIFEICFKINDIYTIGLNYGEIELGTIHIFTDSRIEKKHEEIKSVLPQINLKIRELLSKCSCDNNVKRRLTSEIINNLSHEIRTPLNSVVGLLDVGLNMLENNEESKILCNDIWKSVKDFLRIMDNLILLSELKSQRKDSDKRSYYIIEIFDLIKTQAESVKKGFSKQQVFCKVNSRYEIDNVKVSLDISDFNIVIRELLLNALKYSNTNVYINMLIANDEVEFSILDEGEGMSLKQIKELIEKKSFSNFEFKENNGLGVGLFIVKEICSRNNWNLQIKNKFNLGLKVTLTIPVFKRNLIINKH